MAAATGETAILHAAVFRAARTVLLRGCCTSELLPLFIPAADANSHSDNQLKADHKQ